jgi:multicomponent Na+:H+ antiporter subunit C
MTAVLHYALAGVLLFGAGMSGLFFCPDVLRKILAVNLAGSGVFLVLVAMARRQPGVPPDPVPHALVLTGIVVAVSATAVALALYRRLATDADAAESTEGPRG